MNFVVIVDESVAIYERGEALKRHCETLLKRAEARIQKIAIGPDTALQPTHDLLELLQRPLERKIVRRRRRRCVGCKIVRRGLRGHAVPPHLGVTGTPRRAEIGRTQSTRACATARRPS
jgi:ABC-type glutathione transport system ATPase component